MRPEPELCAYHATMATGRGTELSGHPLKRAWPARATPAVRVAMNVAGAAGAAFFARASLEFYLSTHRLIGVAFFAEEMWFVAAFLVRRPARLVSRRLGDWLLAFGGTFGGLLFRPVGMHPQWGVEAGLGCQLAGLAVCLASLYALGRSFGFAAADRGLVTRGPYAVVRHPVYAAYMIIQLGYLLQFVALWNVAVLLFATGCNIGRALAEERVLGVSGEYAAYRARVGWRLLPGLW
jgi:protein-S-isoprenylcysteine O-methyltransferase Ste14